MSDRKAGCHHCVPAVSPASPGGQRGSTRSGAALPTKGPDLQRRRVTPSKEQGKEKAKAGAGDCDLPFLISQGSDGKDLLWSLAVYRAPRCLSFQQDLLRTEAVLLYSHRT